MSERKGLWRKPARPPKNDEGRMPLMDHLRELRNRLVKSLLAILLVTVVAAFYYKDVAKFLVDPVCDLNNVSGVGNNRECGQGVLVQQGVLNPFSIMLKVSLTTGLVLSAPVWLYQLWGFLAPGLHKHEKRYAISFVALGTPLFAAGAWFSYTILPHALDALLGFTINDANNQIQLDEYLDFVLRMVIVFGLACELPLILILMNVAGIVSARQMVSWWRWVVMGIFVFGAVATPTTDPLTMCLLSIPITVLYLLAVAVAWLNDKRRGRHRDVTLGGDVDDDEASQLDLTTSPVESPAATPAPRDGNESAIHADDIT
ncbi:twin-arginine translocase subunit TatC [Yinghuangia sp. ASG 101]|uniref:twin-arginine translocase subunit TatC n=1 Tax=Yinghuangia sp. ASG 101 TaxID=2896848 RepID=UPI001E2DB529|nr:twin-arginine translocase subunit TatC [Yinghuangia sp. ASG 101]UGQ10704.1 twin-arginine translocase subunit TatC [Yinghuangia sp. ASG 101]